MNKKTKNMLAYICVNNLSIKRYLYYHDPIRFWHYVVKIGTPRGTFNNSVSVLKRLIKADLEYRIDVIISWFVDE